MSVLLRPEEIPWELPFTLLSQHRNKKTSLVA